MAKVIAFASAKGGSGKTTITASFGRLLAELGMHTLMIDFDEATNGLSLLHIDEINMYKDQYEASGMKLDGMFPVDMVNNNVVNIVENLDILPASFDFSLNDQRQSEEYEFKILKVLASFASSYDYILIDAQAGSDAASMAAVSPAVSELVVIVSEYDPMSAAGIERLKSLDSRAFSFDRTYILLNKMLPEFVQSFKEFMSVSHYLAPIPWTADAVRAYSRRAIAFDTEQGNAFTLSIINAFRGLPLPRLSMAFGSWIKKKSSLIRQPVTTQYEETENLLRSAIDLRAVLNKDNKLRLIRKKIVFLLPLILIAMVVSYFTINDNYNNKNIGEIFSGQKFSNSIVNEMIYIIAFLLPFALVFYALGSDVFDCDKKKPSLDNYEEERLSRQIEVYRKKLSELEFLRAASDSELVEKHFSGS
jgi:cellulose biosynthesis protein BcsQ